MKNNIIDYKNIHLLGIGGASMYAIAAQLHHDGKHITGSDMQESNHTNYLKSLGIDITIGHNLNLLNNVDLVIYSSAIANDDPELSFAREHNIECVERAVFLGEYTKDYDNLICISGTHGKSTTTSMIASVFLEANFNPTIQIGASLKKINGNFYIGGKKYFILEACEYVDSFLHFHPNSEVILNIDDDHLDYFGSLDNVKKSFKKYAELLPDTGYLVVNIDDKNTEELLNLKKNTITYGIENKNAMVQARNITLSDFGYPSFDCYVNNEFLDTFNLKVFGKHNVLNALATIAMCLNYNISSDIIKNTLKDFTGVGRRFEYLGTYNEAHIFDDFAHHPTEIWSTYNSAKRIKHNETWAVFQSHTYSRTVEHLEDFADVLSKFDHVIISDIYPAREENIWNVKESDLVNLISKKNKNVLHIPNFQDIALYLKNNIKENDLVITIGAGPVNKVANILLEEK